MLAPVGTLARRTIKDTEIDGYYVPEGTNMFIGIHPTQRMEPWWRNPDTFDPERFNDSRREDAAHKYAWTPFGGGVHKCIGMHFGSMEVKAIMHQLGGLLSLLSGRVRGQVFVSVVAYQPDRPNSNDDLQQHISSVLSEFSLTATIGWPCPEPVSGRQ